MWGTSVRLSGAFGFLSHLGALTYLTGLAYGLSPSAGRVGHLLLLWSMAVLIGEAHGGDPSATAVAFLVGGAGAMLVVGVATVARARLGMPHPAPDEAATPRGPGGTGPNLGVLARSDLGLWSLLRAVLTVIAVVIGYWLTSDLDPYWPTIALLIVFQADLDKTLFKAAQRGLGTLVGAGSAAVMLDVVGAEPSVVIIVLIATVIGIALAIAGMALLEVRARHASPSATSEPNHG